MTNKNRQKSLDKKKWEKSFNYGEDMSGKMPYCEFCDRCEDYECIATQSDREDNCLCARAFNRMIRK